MPNGIQHAPIGHGSALSAEALRGLVMTPRNLATSGIKDGTRDRMLEVLAKLPAADDDEAELAPPPVLALTAEDLAEIKLRSDALSTAHDLRRAADQRAAACRALVQQIDFLQSRSGTLAARAFQGTDADKEALRRHNAALSEAQAAEAALKGLQDEAVEAARQVDAAFGRLRVFTSKAIDRLRCRAASSYTQAIEQARRSLAAISATVDMQHTSYREAASGFYVALSLVRCPALDASLMRDRRGVESHVNGGGDMLLTGQHGALTLQASGFRSKIQCQIDEAVSGSGLRHNNIVT